MAFQNEELRIMSSSAGGRWRARPVGRVTDNQSSVVLQFPICHFPFPIFHFPFPCKIPAMNRRDFMRAAGATLAFGSVPRYAKALADTHKRVGLIGTGWYGKADLFRLIQVAPVEVVSLCDVDKHMLADAAEQVASRQASEKTPRTVADYR